MIHLYQQNNPEPIKNMVLSFRKVKHNYIHQTIKRWIVRNFYFWVPKGCILWGDWDFSASQDIWHDFRRGLFVCNALSVTNILTQRNACLHLHHADSGERAGKCRRKIAGTRKTKNKDYKFPPFLLHFSVLSNKIDLTKRKSKK